RSDDERLLDQLALLATGRPLAQAFAEPEARRWREDVATGKATVTQYIDALLASPSFAESTAAQVFIGKLFMSVMEPYADLLKSPGEGAHRIYYLNKPCAETEAVQVKPWWDYAHPVNVCPDSYRPEVFHHLEGKVWANCAPYRERPECGCGPNLIRCVKD